MSTKATVAHGDNYHLYVEVFEEEKEEHLYLTLEGPLARFEADTGLTGTERERIGPSVTVRLSGPVLDLLNERIRATVRRGHTEAKNWDPADAIIPGSAAPTERAADDAGNPG